MESSALQLTIREMKLQATSPKFWAVLLCIICILTVAAPFSTDERFNTIQLFFYWSGIAVSTHFSSTFVVSVVLRTLKKTGKPETTARIIASLVAAFTVAVVVLFINTVVLDIDEIHWRAFVFLGISCMLIALAISTIFFIVDDTLERGKYPTASNTETTQDEALSSNPKDPKPANSVFYQRLSTSLGIDVISLQAQDHYVDVKTTLGNELVLIRLSDAIKELGEENGIQVHRSWWVTHKHMVEQKRIGGKLHLELSDSSVVPVSRTYSADVKQAFAKHREKS